MDSKVAQFDGNGLVLGCCWWQHSSNSWCLSNVDIISAFITEPSIAPHVASVATIVVALSEGNTIGSFLPAQHQSTDNHSPLHVMVSCEN